jgi:hypothetical protein
VRRIFWRRFVSMAYIARLKSASLALKLAYTHIREGRAGAGGLHGLL